VGSDVRVLLDTHVLVWLVEGLPELKPSARRAIEASARTDGVVISAISFWEIAMLAQRGRLSVSGPVTEWRQAILARPGIHEMPVDGAVGIEATQLPGSLHPDPADRLLVATARIHQLALATHDVRLRAYGKQGHVRVLAV
jgi:PIN domain nuclease of toxin-antitoxin system